MDSNIILLTKNLPLAAAPMEYGSPSSIDKKKSSKSEATVRIPTTNHQVKTSEESAVIPNDGNCTSRVEVNRTECTSAVTGSVSSLEKDFHVVKINISSDQKQKIKIGEGQGTILVASDVPLSAPIHQSESEGLLLKKPKVTVVSLKPDTNNSEQYSSIESYTENSTQSFSTFITDSQNLKTTTHLNSSSEMVQKPNGELEVSNPTYLFYMMTSGQCSPSDTLDSGTCSDLENGHGNTANNNNNSTTPPPLPKKVGPRLKMHLQNTKIVTQDQGSNSITSAAQNPPQHMRTGSFTDSEESESSLSCDSLNSSEFAGNSLLSNIPSPPPPLLTSKDLNPKGRNLSFLPDSLLRDIRDRKFIVNNKDVVDYGAPQRETTTTTTTLTYRNGGVEAPKVISNIVNISSAKDRARDKNKTRVLITRDDIDDDLEKPTRSFENDKFYTFHLNEKDVQDLVEQEPKIIDDESFAGFKDIHSGTSTIRSSKGTVRGVKNRVRNGIATFLQMQQSNVKNYKEKDSGKVVLYTTSMGIVRETYAKCSNVKQILRTLLVKFEERDVFMSSEYQQEIKERMQYDEINVPQLFVEGQHIGDAEAVERLNETGELRKILKPYKSINASYTCQVCGGYRLLPCSSCNGSKKSVHRNHFTAEFVALKCMNCDEVGLVKCHNC